MDQKTHEHALRVVRESSRDATELNLNGHLDGVLTGEILQEILKLTNLTQLKLEYNKLTLVPPELARLTNLTVLSLGGNRLTSVPASLGRLANLTKLNLDRNQLMALPTELSQLTNLTELNVIHNQLTAVPPELGRLTSLTTLSLEHNSLAAVPPELGQLSALTTLSLHNNQLSAVPQELGRLSALTTLSLHNNQLSAVPPELGRLSTLTTLSLGHNRLTALPPELVRLQNLVALSIDHNQLTTLPPELGQLTGLTALSVSANQLTTIPEELGELTNLIDLALDRNEIVAAPPELGQLINLITLALSDNQLTALPKELGDMTNLTRLALDGNKLVAVPAELGKLSSLDTLWLGHNQLTTITPKLGRLKCLASLWLGHNQLTAVPAELGYLTGLVALSLAHNKLTGVPAELGQLTNLGDLRLDHNQLTAVPIELGQLKKLTSLSLEGNRLTMPPPEIIEQGTKAILAYLRESKEDRSVEQWSSKLLVVGEGGVGKTSLLRALRGQDFVSALETTHGIEFASLEVAHPQRPVTMTLNCWDFGGQTIYHATHQFFLTRRSLFLLVWNARVGFQQSKLYYWLDTIQSLAPDSPVIIVATYKDERAAKLPIDNIRASYPQVVASCEVSNKTGENMDALHTLLQEHSAALPLMGERWPRDWLAAANAIRGRNETHLSISRLRAVMADCGVPKQDSQNVLTRWLHELGDLLYFPEDDELRELVILDPLWVTDQISRVLECEEIIDGLGVFRHEHMNKVWSEVEPTLRERLLRLMERFDLSYRIPDDPEDKSIVVERVQYDPPPYQSRWDGIRRSDGCQEISLRFDLESKRPAGVPTWFIAREHRFTLNTHWLFGALFGDDRQEPKRLALVDAPPSRDHVDLTVRGPTPHGFFSLLRDGLELILARFEGLRFRRKIRCQCTDACTHWFDFDKLVEWQERDNPVTRVQCQESGKDVPVSDILYGVHTDGEQSTVMERLGTLDDAIHDRFEDLTELMKAEFNSLAQLVHRGYLHQFRREQKLLESHCPRVFTLRPIGAETWPAKLESLVQLKWELQLCCESPGCWHPLESTGRYEIQTPQTWIGVLVPYVNQLIKVLKFASPIVGPWTKLQAPEYQEMLKDHFNLMKGFISNLKELDWSLDQPTDESPKRVESGTRAKGAILRRLRHLLDELDPNQHWGGLQKVLTPEGHYLWLCPSHAEEFAR